MEKDNFVHLHFHTSYSFLDGWNPIEKAVKRIKELNMDACAITDHGNVCGCMEFLKECHKNGIKPILGTELYFTEDVKEMMKPAQDRRNEAIEKATKAGAIKSLEEFDKLKTKDAKELLKPFANDQKDYHIILLAKNQLGWKNLIKIVSESGRLCLYNGRPHCDYEILKKYHEGVICSTACIGSFPSHQIVKGEWEKADKYLNIMREIFKDDFYLEIQPVNLTKQHLTNLYYMKYAQENNIKCIATNDVHWTNYEDYDDHDTLLCVGLKIRKDAPDRKMVYLNDYWIKSGQEMFDSFAKQTESMSNGEIIDNDNDNNNFIMSVADFECDINDYIEFYKEAICNTRIVADKIEDNIELGSPVPLFSNVKVPEGMTPNEWMTFKAAKGLYKYLAEHPECDKKLYEKRLNEELEIILPKGFAPYFLAVEEYVTWANEHNVPTGPGRGSAAGSLALFCLGVTRNIDPIKNKLWFSRFMTAERTAMPDIDVDFEFLGRELVVKHLEDYYGKDHVAHIGTYSYLGVKSSIKDVARAIGLTAQESNAITKEIALISDDPNLSFKKIDSMKDGETEAERNSYLKFAALEKKYEKLFQLCRKFENVPRQQGIHASGILVTPMPVTDLFPCRYDKNTGTAVTIYTGTQLEENNAVNLSY